MNLEIIRIYTTTNTTSYSYIDLRRSCSYPDRL